METQIAAAVFAVGVVSLVPLTVANVRSNETAGVRSQALALAQAKVEDLRALPYDTFAGVTTGGEALPQGYSRQWAVLDAPATPGDGSDLKRLLVTVSWNRPGVGAGSVLLPASRGRR